MSFEEYKSKKDAEAGTKVLPLILILAAMLIVMVYLLTNMKT